MKTIKELCEKIKSGEINESDLMIVLDNDQTRFYLLSEQDKKDLDDVGIPDSCKLKVDEANGYYDIFPLYKLLFPNAKVDWG